MDNKLKEKADKLTATFKSFDIEANVVNIIYGANVTRFELTAGTETKVSRLFQLKDEIMLEMAVPSLRMEAPVLGKSGEPCIAIEIPNDGFTPVMLKDLTETDEFKSSGPLTVVLGEDLNRRPVYCDISKMPHLLIAGSTGSGKSIWLQSVLSSILTHSSPEDVRMILVDTKVIEFYPYNGIPHLLLPVINDAGKAVSALNWAVTEMRRRHELFKKEQVRDIRSYNEKYKQGAAEHLPYILIVVDEFAELMMNHTGDTEMLIGKIAMLGRISGIHLIMATQRPSYDVITGDIKANIGSRIAFAVTSQVDSRAIIDRSGAEDLLGRGDMLYFPMSSPHSIRLQGAFVNEDEVERITDLLRKTYGANYDDEVAGNIESCELRLDPEAERRILSDTELFNAAVDKVFENGYASVSVLQRELGIGYPAAARLIDRLEKERIIGPFEDGKPRQILITEEEWNNRRNNNE